MISKERGETPGRAGHPGDVDAAALFPAFREAGFITGVDLVVDGGMVRGVIYV